MHQFRYKILVFLLVFSVLSISSCKNKNQNSKQQEKNQTQKLDSLKDTTTVLFKFNDKIFGVPSPILVSKIVKQMHLPYEPGLINPADSSSNYIDNFKQAINLGIYGADFGYLDIYQQTNLLGKYYKTIKQLAQNLDLLDVINQMTLNKIEENNDNPDSLMYLVSNAFRDIDAYLNQNNLEKIGALIIAGGWIESLYFLTQLYKKYPQPELLQKIGEQKSPLNNVIHSLEPYYNKGDKDLDFLYESLTDISSYYDNIKIKYQYDPPEVFPNKHLTIIHSKTIVNINKNDLSKISQKIQKLRNWAIN